jgi:hypothetical protein
MPSLHHCSPLECHGASTDGRKADRKHCDCLGKKCGLELVVDFKTDQQRGGVCFWDQQYCYTEPYVKMGVPGENLAVPFGLLVTLLT